MRAYNCNINELKKSWAQFYPAEEKKESYTRIIEKNDQNFNSKRIIYWYKSNEEDIYACSLEFSYREHRKYYPGCFTIQYMLEATKDGGLTFKSMYEIVCT